MIRSRRKRRLGDTRMQLPLTPMIDVTFQLLLFFLTATTWRQAEGQIPGSLPDPARQVSQQAIDQLLKPLVLDIRAGANGRVVYDLSGLVFEQPQPLQMHLAGLREALGSDQVPVIIQPGKDVPWQHVVEVYNQVLRSGYKSVVLTAAQ